MANARESSALIAFTLLLAGCTSARPPAELSGLWSAGQAACSAGVGVRFGAESIDAVYDEQQETLFQNPHYEVEGDNPRFRVRIRYELPRRPGGAHSVGAYGVLVLERGGDGAIAPVTHNLIDGFTGSARLRIVNDPAYTALTLEPCGSHHWREELRGLQT